jgi:hypothetical protein
VVNTAAYSAYVSGSECHVHLDDVSAVMGSLARQWSVIGQRPQGPIPGRSRCVVLCANQPDRYLWKSRLHVPVICAAKNIRCGIEVEGSIIAWGCSWPVTDDNHIDSLSI